MGEHQLHICVDGQDLAESGRVADDLRMTLLEEDPTLEIVQMRSDAATMDPGSVLAIILGTPSAIVMAKALLKWSSRNNAVRLSVKTKNGTVIARNLESKDVPEIVAALTAAEE